MQHWLIQVWAEAGLLVQVLRHTYSEWLEQQKERCTYEFSDKKQHGKVIVKQWNPTDWKAKEGEVIGSANCCSTRDVPHRLPFWAKEAGCCHPCATPTPLPARRVLSYKCEQKELLCCTWLCHKTPSTSDRKGDQYSLTSRYHLECFSFPFKLRPTILLWANLPWTSPQSFVCFLLGPLASLLIQVRLALYGPTSSPPHAQQAVRLCLIPLRLHASQTRNCLLLFLQ